MKLTETEKRICETYRQYDSDGFLHCCDCPLNVIDGFGLECYATIDGRSTQAKRLKRYDSEKELSDSTLQRLYGKI